MRKTLFYIVLLSTLSLPAQLLGQKEIKLDDLRTPTSPATVLLGNTPASIIRPTTPKGIATTLLSGVTSDGIAPGLALEVAPFWLKPQYDFTYKEYYNIDDVSVGTKMWRSIKYNSSFSVSTASLSDSLSGVGLATGFRTSLAIGEGRRKEEVIKLIKKVQNTFDYSIIYDRIKTIISNDYVDTIGIESLRKEYKRAIEYYRTNPDKFNIGTEDLEERKNVITQLEGQLLKNIEDAWYNTLHLTNESKYNLDDIDIFFDLVGNTSYEIVYEKLVVPYMEQLKEIQNGRGGFFADFAMAHMASFPTGKFDSTATNSRLGIWLQFGFSPLGKEKGTKELKEMKTEFLFMGRYIHEFGALRHVFQEELPNQDSTGTEIKNINAFDFGFRFVASKKDFSFSVEGILRINSGKITDVQTRLLLGKIYELETTYRLAGNFEYKLSDMFYITATFGKDFSGPFSFESESQFIGLVGLNISPKGAQMLKVE